MASVTVNPTSRSNTFTAGPNTFLPASTSAVSLIVKGAVSQTGDLQQWQTSAATVVSKILSTGAFSSTLDASFNGVAAGKGRLATGLYNTAFGQNANYNVTTGVGNVGIGASANGAVTTGGSNTTVGAFALDVTTTGSNNTAVGNGAIRSGTSDNVGIGALAGYSSTGSGNVFIGYSAGQNETGSNKLYIANTNTATPLIGGDFSTARLTIGGSLSRGAPVTKTADFTLASTENWVINNKSGSSCVVTFPSASTYSGREVMLNNYQAQTVVSASSNVVPQGGGAAGTAILAATAGKWATLVSDGTNWIIMNSN